MKLSVSLLPLVAMRENLWCLTRFLVFFFLEALKVQSANKDVFVPTHSCCKLEEVEEAKDES